MINEKRAVLRAKSDPEAFGEIYDHYYSKIFRFILYRTGRRDVAEDLTAETFFQALKNLWRFRYTRNPFSSWLYKIAVTQVAMFYRQQKRYCETTFEECPDLLNATIKEDPTIYLQESIDRNEEYKKMHASMDALTEDEKNVIALRYFEDLSVKEVSQVLRMKENTVKSHTRRALAKLREKFEENSGQKKEFEKNHYYGRSGKIITEPRA